MAQVAPSLRCPRCGAPLPPEASERVRCGHCGGEIVLDARWRQNASAYRDAVSGKRGLEAVARRAAAMHLQAERMNRPIILATLLLGLWVAWWIMASAAGLSARLPLWIDAALVAATVATLLALFGGFAAIVRAPSFEQLAAMGSAECHHCGGMAAFEEGQAMATCPYCGSTALTPSSLARDLLRRATEEARGATHRAHDAATANVASARRAGTLFGSFHALIGAVVLAALALTLGVVALLGRGRPAVLTPTFWIWPTLVVAFAGCLVWVVLAVRRTIADNERFEATFGVSIVAEMQRLAAMRRR